MKTMKTLLSASLALTALSGCQPETEKPNILFLLVDDMQSDAIAALGNKNVYTPNIDGLIAEGVYPHLHQRCPLRCIVNAQPCHADDRKGSI